MFEKLRENFERLSRDARDSVVLRYRLAMIELKADLRNLCGLIGFFIFALIGVLAGIAVLAVWVAELLQTCVPLCAHLWTMIVGLTAIALSLLIAWGTWHGFRHRWIFLEQTLEELREDIAWLKEWSGKEPEPIDKPSTDKEPVDKEPAGEEPAKKEPSSTPPSEPAPPSADPSPGEES